MSDFYQLLFSQKSKTIESLDELIYFNSKTFFTFTDQTLLERVIMYYNEKKLIDKKVVIDKNILLQLGNSICENIIELQTKYDYKLSNECINELITKIAFVLDQIIYYKVQLKLPLKVCLQSLICYHNHQQVLDTEIIKIVQDDDKVQKQDKIKEQHDTVKIDKSEDKEEQDENKTKAKQTQDKNTKNNKTNSKSNSKKKQQSK